VKRDIEEALEVLAHGGTIVFPTETLYGLGALATHKAAVRKVYSIKRRPKEKLLPVIIGDLVQAKKYFIFNKNDQALAKKFWPGPLALVVRTKSKKISAALGSELLAVRYPANPLAASLAKLSGTPIISTSANISGQPGCFTIAAVKKQFAHVKGTHQPDLFLDGGRLKKSLPSTIVKTKKDSLIVIREGAVNIKEVRKALG
jgi:L-threonylcarbamoyladenylate synthase